MGELEALEAGLMQGQWEQVTKKMHLLQDSDDSLMSILEEKVCLTYHLDHGDMVGALQYLRQEIVPKRGSSWASRY